MDRERSSIEVLIDDSERTFDRGTVFLPEPGQPIDPLLDVVLARYGTTAAEFGYDGYAGV